MINCRNNDYLIKGMLAINTVYLNSSLIKYQSCCVTQLEEKLISSKDG